MKKNLICLLSISLCIFSFFACSQKDSIPVEIVKSGSFYNTDGSYTIGDAAKTLFKKPKFSSFTDYDGTCYVQLEGVVDIEDFMNEFTESETLKNMCSASERKLIAQQALIDMGISNSHLIYEFVVDVEKGDFQLVYYESDGYEDDLETGVLLLSLKPNEIFDYIVSGMFSQMY